MYFLERKLLKFCTLNNIVLFDQLVALMTLS